MEVGIALMAEGEFPGGAADGRGGGTTVVADLGTDMLPGESVSSVDLPVAADAETSGVRAAVDHRRCI